jgi:DNA-binding beta-propeller fold protein YncE
VATTWGADDERPDQTGGYIWDSVLRAGLSVRHYGLWEDELYYSPGTPYYLPIVRDAAAKNSVQGIASTVALVGRTDPYFRGWDLNVPDEYRYEEWKREFDQYVQKSDLPALEVVCLMMDHTGSFSTNVGHLNTPELQVASNDHALGQLVDAVSHSPYWKDTAIFVVEDDAQDGPDHIDSHRSPGFVISAYTKRNKVVSDFYNTDSILRTIEDILGVNYLGLDDANSQSMDAVFQTTPDLKPYTVIVPGNLLQSPVDPSLVLDRNSPRMEKTKAVALRHDGNWWVQQTNKMNFTKADMIDAASYNRLLWRGIKGENVPYPSSEVRISKTKNRDTETE